MNLNNSLLSNTGLPLHPAEEIDLEIFNSIQGPDYKDGKPVKDLKRLFNKQVIVDDETILNIETIKTPGFIGIADEEIINNSEGKTISGHEDIVQFLERYGLLICTYQYNKDRYGEVIDLRWSPQSNYEIDELMEIFIKNEGHHSGIIVPATREAGNKAFASFNEPDTYHKGLYGESGFVALAQNIVFPEFVNSKFQRGYTDSIICWMALMNPFVKFSQNDFNGGDPTTVIDKASLEEFLKNCALASLGDETAIDFFKNPDNKAYCSEFVYIGLNTLVYPFNLQGLTSLLNDEAKAGEILAIQEKQNRRQENILSNRSANPEFQAFNIQMPVVPESLPPLSLLMAENGISVDFNSIPFPAFTLSHILRRAFRTLLPRHQDVNNPKIIQAQVKLFGYLEPLIIKQLGLDNPYAEGFSEEATAERNNKLAAVKNFINLIKSQLKQEYNSYAELDAVIDEIMKQANELMGVGDAKYFIPPRIYVDLGQNDGDGNLPQGWGFKLNTLGTLIYRGAIRDTAVTPQPPTPEIPPENPEPTPENNPPREKSQMR
ncbi:MAG: hypothetical protein AAFR37_03770 [Cyanobacteria bacterium J06628_3]